MRTAIVYDYIPQFGGGGERALTELIEHYAPNVSFYAAFAVDSPFSRKFLAFVKEKCGPENVHVGPTIRFATPLLFRIFNFLLPSILQSYNFSAYDLVVSYTAFLAHSIVPPIKGKHFVYFNTPARFLWNLSHAESLLKRISSPFLITDIMRYRTRLYDLSGLPKASAVYAISEAVAQRVETFYNKAPISVIYPPSIDESFLDNDFRDTALMREVGTFFAFVARLESYKNIELLIELAAKSAMTEKIFIMGDGPHKKALLQKATQLLSEKPSTFSIKAIKQDVTKIGPLYFTGYIDEVKKFQVLASASASFSLNDEDFGITKVESLAVGTPVIAYIGGSTPEVVHHGKNGLIFEDPTVNSLAAVIKLHRILTYDKTFIKESARKFSTQAFHHNLDLLIHA